MPVQVVSAHFFVSGELRDHISSRRRSFAVEVIPSLIVAYEGDAESQIYLGFHDPKVLASADPLFLATFDDGLELLILQEELLESLKGSTLGIKNGALAVS